MDSTAKINTLRQMLRIKYAGNIGGLKKLWEEVAAGATEFVEITGTSFEGGSATGVQVLDRLEYLAAVQAIMAELDPAGTPLIPPAGTYVSLAFGRLES